MFEFLLNKILPNIKFMSFGDIESVDGDLDFNENCVLGRNIDIAGYVGYLFNFAYLYVFHNFPYMILAL